MISRDEKHSSEPAELYAKPLKESIIVCGPKVAENSKVLSMGWEIEFIQPRLANASTFDFEVEVTKDLDGYSIDVVHVEARVYGGGPHCDVSH